MRPTTTDIAKAANVSLASVDRVLNGRAGVSAKIQSSVNEAIDKLGYVRDVSAANLAKKRQYDLAFVLPQGSSLFDQTVQSEIKEMAKRGYSERTNITLATAPSKDPHALAGVLHRLSREKIDGVAVMAPETPQVRDAIAELKKQGIAVVAVVSNQPKSDCDHFVGIDNVAAGRTAAVLMGRFLPAAAGDILVLTSSIHSHDSIDRRLGFDHVMTTQFPHLRVLPTLEGHGESDRITGALKNALRASDAIVGVYSLGTGNRALSAFLKSRQIESKLTIIAHELTAHTKAALQDETIDAVITQNIGHVVRSAVRVLKAKSDRIEIDTYQEHIRIEIMMKENLT